MGPWSQTSLTRPDTISAPRLLHGAVIRREDKIIASDNNPSDTGHWGPGWRLCVSVILMIPLMTEISAIVMPGPLNSLATAQTQSGHNVTLEDTLTLARQALGKIADAEHTRYHEDFGQLGHNQ